MKNNGSKKISTTLQTLNGLFILSAIMFFIGIATSFAIAQNFINRLDAQILIAFVFGIFTTVFFLDIQKFNIVKSIESIKTTKVDPNSLSQIDEVSLNSYTQILNALGFKQLGELSITSEHSKTSLGISRILCHCEYNCFAEIGKSFSVTNANKEHLMFCTFSSYLENPWKLATGNLTEGMNGFSHMMRRPKRLWQIFPQFGTNKIEELLKKHLELRQEISSTLNLEVKTELTLDSYIDDEQNEMLQRQAVFEKKYILVALIEAYLFELNPKTEWLGDYAKFAKRNKKRS